MLEKYQFFVEMPQNAWIKPFLCPESKPGFLQ